MDHDPWQPQAWLETVAGQIVTSLCSPGFGYVSVWAGGKVGVDILLWVRCGTSGLDLQ